ncbi:MAG: ATP-dependent helicase [Clostridiales bacterium]|nr:ATP-dependent helicase [Clostridiales bacterium]
MNFNPSQQEAISHKDGPMLVLAGPGSGKTAVITQRTINLIKNCGVRPEHILVITFTKAAATEMRQRFEKAMDGPAHVTFGTFHAVFFTVLKHAYHFSRDNIVTGEQRYRFMREILSRHDVPDRNESEFIDNILGDVSRVKNDGTPLEEFEPGHCEREVFADVYQEYAKSLRQHRLVDFDDMLTYTYELFSQRQDILAAWQDKYRYILIDEFQDINRLQYDIVRLMARPRDNLFIVGDDDQSIYRFRGAKPEIMLGFLDDYPDARQVLLDTNYRCVPDVVEAAGRLILHNTERFPKDITAARKPVSEDSAVSWHSFEDIKEENDFITKAILGALENGVPPQEIAVLCRTNAQPRPLTEKFVDSGIPFFTRDAVPNLYEHWISRDIFSYLRIAHGGRNRADYLSIMNKPKRYVARDSLINAEVFFEDWIKYYESYPWIAERIGKLMREMRLLEKMPPYAAVNFIRKGIGYDEFLKEYAGGSKEKEKELFGVADELAGSASGYPTMFAWTEHIRDYKRQMENMDSAPKEAPEAVTVSTLHSSKGLEYKIVFLLDVNEGIMPYRKAVLPADVEEERRLFYVGMTRAKDRLYLCSTKSRAGQTQEPSRFQGEVNGEAPA